MLFEVDHLTRFTYSRPVFIEPHLVRLRPRSDIFQHLISYSLRVDPTPQGSSELIDAEGNAVTQIWFGGLSPSLTLHTTCTVETLRPNPFDYVVPDVASLQVPMSYSPAESHALAHYREPPGDPAVAAFAREVLRSAAGEVTGFLAELCARIRSRVTQVIRPEGDAYSAAQTLEAGSGACRDISVLFIDCCRAAGVAARFVTGYEQGDPESDRDLHAWAEVFLNGAGWRGWDPSQGLAVADRHVAVAVGPSPVEAAPTAGTYRGTGVSSTLETVIRLDVRDRAAEGAVP